MWCLIRYSGSLLRILFEYNFPDALSLSITLCILVISWKIVNTGCFGIFSFHFDHYFQSLRVIYVWCNSLWDIEFMCPLVW